MTTLQTIGLWLLVFLILMALSSILKFYNISTSEYAVYVLFYLFLVLTYVMMPDKTT
jgi:uncharacterized membrane protein YtjA (UPF0391 family)